MYKLYILKCNDDSYYVGITEFLKKRIVEHNSGLSFYTKSKLPVKLVYSKEYIFKEEAAKRERQIKGWTRVKKEKLINGDFA
ncbi:MAG: GIY-YIG nuclease family protein [Candidatus Riflemargulisbacteria bacterium]